MGFVMHHVSFENVFSRATLTPCLLKKEYTSNSKQFVSDTEMQIGRERPRKKARDLLENFPFHRHIARPLHLPVVDKIDWK